MIYTNYKKRVASALVTVLSVACLFLFSTTAYCEMMSVNGDKVNLRSGPGTKYAVKWEYGSGFPLKILQRKGKWVKVKDFENDTGWIHKTLLTKEPCMIVKANKDQDTKINIREKPGTNNKVVGQAYYGVVFKTLQQRADWVKVMHESGLTGWINRSLLWGY